MLLEKDFLKSLEKIELIVRKTLTTNFMGQHRSKDIGGGLEFVDYRQYQIGDDYRYIDWNLYSRLGQLFLKQFSEEREILLYFLLDQSKSMSFGSIPKFEIAVKIAAALGYIGLSQLDRVGAAFFDEELNYNNLISGKGKDWVYRYFSFLEKRQPGGNTNIDKAVTRFSHQYNKPGLILVLSDFLDKKGYKKGLKRLRENNWQVCAVHILAQEEINPELNGEIQLVDIESNEKKELIINQNTLTQYKEKLNDFSLELENFCTNYGIDYFKVNTGQNLENIIYSILKMRRSRKYI